MSEVDKLVNAMAEELNSPNEYSLSTNPESNPSYILINSDRTLTVPENLRKIGIQHDHNVESLVFKCPRYNDGIDLSQMSVIAINWTNSKNTKGKAYCHDITCDDNYLTFVWTVAQDVTFERGILSILVCMVKPNDDGGEELHWNSEINRELYIGDGLAVSSDEIINTYTPSITDQLLSRMAAAEYTVDSYKIDSTEIDGGYRVTTTDSRGTESFDILHGTAVEKGATFTPSVTEDGVLSWTNDGGLANPDPINIKGAKGDRGETVYIPSVSEEGVLSWTNDGGLENPEAINIKGPQGDIGPVGPQGPIGVGEQGPMGATYEAMPVIEGMADVDPFQKYRINIPMNCKSFTESGIDLLGEYSSSWHVTHAVSYLYDIYYIVQTNITYTAWPKFMKYNRLTNQREQLFDMVGYAIDPIESSMFVFQGDIYILNYLVSDDFGESGENKYGHLLIWHRTSSGVFVEVKPQLVYPEDKTYMDNPVISPAIAVLDGRVQIFGGRQAIIDTPSDIKYSNKIYEFQAGTRPQFTLKADSETDSAEDKTPSNRIKGDIYSSSIAVIGSKAYIFSPTTGICTIYDGKQKYLPDGSQMVWVGAVTERLQTNIKELVDISVGYDGSRSNITATVVIGELIYLFVSNTSGESSIITFDTQTHECTAVHSEDIYGVIPNGAYGNYEYGPLPTIYINDKPYIIRRDQKPLIFEDSGDMEDEYLYLTSEEFLEPIPLGIDLYDRNRDVVEFEIHRIEFNDIGTALHMHYTHNGVSGVKSYPVTWVNKDVAKDTSLVRLHVEHANTVLRYNTNTEYGSITGIEADIEQLKVDMEKLSVATEYQKKTDNSLETESKEIVGAINEVNSKVGQGGGSSLDVQINGTSIVENGVANIPLDAKVDKVAKDSKVLVYTNDDNNTPTTTHYLGNDNNNYSPYNIPMIYGAAAGGGKPGTGYLVTNNPINKYHCTNKQYVDDLFNGSNKAIVYSNYEEMVSSLVTKGATDYNIGQNIMVITLNVPDLWISGVEETQATYTYSNDADIVNELNTNGSIQIGYYTLSALETQKVDLTEYPKDVQINGTSIVENGVAKIPIAENDSGKAGLAMVGNGNNTGIAIDKTTKLLKLNGSTESMRQRPKSYSVAVLSSSLYSWIKYGIVQNDETLTAEQKESACKWLGTTKLYKYTLENVGENMNQVLVLISPNDNLSIRRIYSTLGDMFLCINTTNKWGTVQVPTIISAMIEPFDCYGVFETTSNLMPLYTRGSRIDFDTEEADCEFIGISGFHFYMNYPEEDIYLSTGNGAFVTMQLNAMLPYYANDEQGWYNEDGTDIVNVKPLYRVEV